MRFFIVTLCLFWCATGLSAQSFTIAVDPPSQTTTDATSTWTVSVMPSGGFSAPVYFRAHPIDMPATAQFTPNVLQPPYNGNVSLRVVYSGLKNGSTYQIEVEGYNGIASVRDTVTVTVPNKSAWQSISLADPQFSEAVSGRRFVLDKDGNCWFASRGGIFRFDGTTKTMIASIDPGIAVGSVLAADGSGLWVCTDVNGKEGLARYDGATWTRYDSTTGVPSSVLSGTIAWGSGEFAATARNGKLWAWTNTGLLHYDGLTWNRYPYPVGIGPWMAADRMGGFWMTGFMDPAPYYKLVNFDGSYWHEYALAEVGFPYQADGRFISLGVDPGNRLWTTHAAPNTIYIFDIAAKTASRFTDDDGSGNVGKGVTCAAWDPAGNVLIGHGKSYHFESRPSPGGVHRWDGTQWWYYTKENSGLLDNNVYDIQVDQATNTIWILTETGLSRLDGNAPPGSTIIAGVEEHSIANVAGRELVAAYPNPASGMATIALNLASPSRLHLSVMSAVGQLVTSPIERMLDAGTQHVMIDLSSLAPGTYFLRAMMGDHVEALPLTVVR